MGALKYNSFYLSHANVLPLKTPNRNNIIFLHSFDSTIRVDDTLDLTREYHNLLQRNEGGQTTNYTYDFGLLSADGNPYLLDELGSPIRFENEVYAYNEFGNNLHEHTPNQPFSYTGYAFDEIAGNYFVQARQYDPTTGRFTSEDIIKGFQTHPFTLNHYAYCWNSPMNLVDLDGLAPTDWEAAHMARNVYDPHDLENRPLVGGWQVYGDFLVDDPALRMVAYFRYVDGVREYTVVNRGTDLFNPSCWWQNIVQPLGISSAIWASQSVAQNFVNERPNASITFVGHSKGGAEAVANAYATNRDALVFNPAEFVSFWYTSTSGFTGDIRTFVVNSEILDFVMVMGLLRGGGSDASHGELIRLPRPANDRQPWLSRLLFGEDGGLSLRNHGMEAVIASMRLAGFADEGCDEAQPEFDWDNYRPLWG